MFISNKYYGFIILAILFVLNNQCFCMSWESFNGTSNEDDNDLFSSAVATWYGEPTGSGSGGACGLANDVVNAPYYGMTSAGNNNIFKSGAGCGSCYKVKCTEHSACSRRPVTVTITNECPGTCNNEAFHFDLSGKAFGYLAKSGQEDILRKAGRINIHYSRVNCYYQASIALKIETGSNQYFLEFAVENVNGDGELSSVEIISSNGGSLSMRRDYGEAWAVGLPSGFSAPYSFKFTDARSRTVYADRVIPPYWNVGGIYYSSVNF